MSAASRFDAFQIVLRRPGQGIPVAAAARALLAVERLYTLACLVDHPCYRDRLANRFRFPDRGSSYYTGRVPARPAPRDLADLLDDADRLQLLDQAVDGPRRYVLSGLVDIVGDLRRYVQALDVRQLLAANAESQEVGRRRAASYEERLRRQVFSLDVAPWYRGCFLRILGEMLDEVRTAAYMFDEGGAVVDTEQTASVHEPIERAA